MTIEKFTVRLMSDDDRMLAWAEVLAVPRPQDSRASCPLFAEGSTQFVIEQAGTAAYITVYWNDLGVARKQALLGAGPATPGQVYNFTWIEPVWLVGGMSDIVLPTVTAKGPVIVAPPTGSLSPVGT